MCVLTLLWARCSSAATSALVCPRHETQHRQLARGPRVGTAFVQGRAPAVGFYDVGKVVAKGLRVCVPTGGYSGVVKVRESAPNAPEDGIQLKYYAPHVGLVRIAAQGGDSREVMVLKALRRLCPRELRAVRAEALRLDRRAHHVSKDYRATGRPHRTRW